MRASLLVVLLSLLGAGCVVPNATLDPGAAAGAAHLRLDEAVAAPGVALVWNATEPLRAPRSADNIPRFAACFGAGDCVVPDPPCEPRRCVTRVVEVAAPEGGYDGTLAVQLRWPSDHTDWLGLRVRDASGAVLATGVSIATDHLGSAAIVESPLAGLYTIEIFAMEGEADYQVGAQLVPSTRHETTIDLLPDMVALPPTDLRIEAPTETGFSYFIIVPADGVNAATGALGARGCTGDEVAAGARRCLRFSTGVGNAGEGPLDILLSIEEGATSVTGGRFLQRILRSDGSTSDASAGAAELHVAHGHWHNAAANRNVVYARDPATGERGDAVAEGRKVGICFADVTILDPAHPRPSLPAHAGVECLNPAPARTWSMGLSAGWFDLYPWILPDQYVEIGDLADGEYVLCSIVNAEATLVESDPENNESCTAFRLEGDAVETLDPLPYHAEPVE